jgi:putative NADH-flavin reductase
MYDGYVRRRTELLFCLKIHLKFSSKVSSSMSRVSGFWAALRGKQRGKDNPPYLASRDGYKMSTQSNFKGKQRIHFHIIFQFALLALILLSSPLPAASNNEHDPKTCANSNNICQEPPSIKMTMTTTLVVGATGATGKHVVAQLLDKGHKVRAIVRSREGLEEKLGAIAGFDFESKKEGLSVLEGAILDVPSDDLVKQVEGCDAVVSCLGHVMDFSGIYGHPRRLVKDSVAILTSAMSDNQKFILMGSDGVANPLGGDDTRSFSERVLLSMLRNLLPPHADNEEAADYLASKVGVSKSLEWSVVRPTDLIDGAATDYALFDKPQGSLFGSGEASRANVAKCMVDMILSKDKWEEYKFKMPVLHNAKPL